MAIGCGAKCAKIILICFNFVFWLSGAALLALGIWILVDPEISNFVEVIQLSSSDPYVRVACYILIGIGALIFVVGFFGCCGAIKESKCMLGLYLFFLVIVMGGELAAGILVAVFKGPIENDLSKKMTTEVKEEYGKGTSFDKSWNYIQYEFECCGVENPSDYKDSYYQTESADKKQVPPTCCKKKADATFEKFEANNLQQCRSEAQTYLINPETTLDELHTKGCFNSVQSMFSQYATILIGVACGIAALEVFGFIFAVCLCRNLGDIED